MTHSFPTRRSSDIVVDGDSAQPSCALLVWWDLDAWVLKAEVDERFAAFEVRQDGRRCVVDVEDIDDPAKRSEEHTSELQSLMRISYAVFCLKKKKINLHNTHFMNIIYTNNT